MSLAKLPDIPLQVAEGNHIHEVHFEFKALATRTTDWHTSQNDPKNFPQLVIVELFNTIT